MQVDPRTGMKRLAAMVNGFHRHRNWQVFSDFVEMSALAMSNAVDLFQYDKREARYMDIVRGYEHQEVQEFPKMFAELVNSLEFETSDVLGRVYHELELHNKWTGQYFTPFELCRMMTRMTINDGGDLKQKIYRRGFITLQEPACGSGAMVVAFAEEMKAAGINYQKHLHVTAIDVDPKCVHMAYLQCSLLHIPAVIVHGNSLTLEEWGHWYTPAHILGGWGAKLRRPEPPMVELPPAPDNEDNWGFLDEYLEGETDESCTSSIAEVSRHEREDSGADPSRGQSLPLDFGGAFDSLRRS